MPSVSAPNWATILSGMGPEQHGVTSNELEREQLHDRTDPQRIRTGTFRQSLPRSENISRCQDRLFSRLELAGFLRQREIVSVAEFTKGHPAITERAAKFIKADKPHFTFVYYGCPRRRASEGPRFLPNICRPFMISTPDIAALVVGIERERYLRENEHRHRVRSWFLSKEHGGESMIEMEVPWLNQRPGHPENVLLEQPNDAYEHTPTIGRASGNRAVAGMDRHPSARHLKRSTIVGGKQYVPKPSCVPGWCVRLEPATYVLSTPISRR